MQGNHSVWKRKDAGASGPGILVDPLTALHNLPAWAAVDRTAPVLRRRPKTPPSLRALSCQRPSPWQEMSATDDWASGPPKSARQNPSYTRRPKTPSSAAALSCQAPRRQAHFPAKKSCNRETRGTCRQPAALVSHRTSRKGNRSRASKSHELTSARASPTVVTTQKSPRRFRQRCRPTRKSSHRRNPQRHPHPRLTTDYRH